MLSAVILAGGASRRMGRDKAWIEWRGRSLLAWAVGKVRQLGVRELFISGRADVDYATLGCPVLQDAAPGLGPLGGIERGLAACTSPLLLVLAVDMPRLTEALLQRLVARCGSSTGAVPRLGGELEPLVAIYPKRCHAFASEALARGRRAAREFAAVCLRERAVRVVRIAPADAGGFANWNLPADVADGGVG